MADRPIKALHDKTPLETAHTPNMDYLAKNGKTGLMYTVKKGIAPESDVAVISILGYNPLKYSTGRGILEAVGANIPVKNGNLALRCNFATLGTHNRIIDRRAGRDLTTAEAARLTKSINKNVTLQSHPATFTFKNTIAHRAVLVIKSPKTPLSSNITNTDPAYTRLNTLGIAQTNTKTQLQKCKPTDTSKEAKTSADLINEFTQKTHTIMDTHEVNKKRAAQGKLKANVILTRDAGHLLPRFPNINKKYHLRFASLTDMPVERGISKLAGMHTIRLPPPTSDTKKDCTLRLNKLLNALPKYDCLYTHIKGPDEPGHDGNYTLKTRLIALIDEYFFGKLLPKIDLKTHIICVTADHATPCTLRAHSDDPVPLLISGNRIKGDRVSKFSEKTCEKGSLGVLERGTDLMPRLVRFLKK